MPEDPKPGQGTVNPVTGPLPPDSQRAKDREHKSQSVVGKTNPPPTAPVDKNRENESEESKRLRRESPAAPGTSGLTAPDPKKTAEVVDKVNKLVEDINPEHASTVLNQAKTAIALNKTVARAAQLRKRPDPDIKYPTTRLDPKLKDSEAQIAVAEAGQPK